MFRLLVQCSQELFWHSSFVRHFNHLSALELLVVLAPLESFEISIFWVERGNSWRFDYDFGPAVRELYFPSLVLHLLSYFFEGASSNQH
jgi:hypothetical protein